MENVSIRSMKRLQAAPAWRVCLCVILFSQVRPLSQMQISLNDRDQGAASSPVFRFQVDLYQDGCRSQGEQRVKESGGTEGSLNWRKEINLRDGCCLTGENLKVGKCSEEGRGEAWRYFRVVASEGSCFLRWEMYQVKADGCFIGEAREQQLGRNSEAVFAADGAESNSSAVFRGALWKSRLTLWFWGHFLWANLVFSHHQCGPHFSLPSWFPLLFTPLLLTVFVRQY